MTAFATAPSSPLMPLPAELQWGAGRLVVSEEFNVAALGRNDPRLRDGVVRLMHRLQKRTGLTFSSLSGGDFSFSKDAANAHLVIVCVEAGAAIPTLGEDESYFLVVTPAKATLRAQTVLGALHGFETLLQLLQSDADGWFLPAVSVNDRPRFPWRGLMIDVARHWQPMEVIKRNLDGMALVKLNVLHLHLSDDQGFRIESKTFPHLHELGSDGRYFTQEQMRELIAYAAARGIRMVPEFDIPGHATSWLVAFPELGSAPWPYTIERKWGIFDPVLDPTNPKVYELLDGFLGEMAALFSDRYLHIGGDENNGVHWTANAGIQAFIREHNLKDNAGLHAYFNGRVHAILTKHGKQLVGWDEILHPDLPAGSVIHSWRGPEGINHATRRGFSAILSNGYYIDLCHPASEHFLNDPIPAETPLTAAQQKLVLGGEATMWSEWVTPETIDSRIWPRTAAIAERLWSPREIRDVSEMYRRLAVVSQRLEDVGLQHENYVDPMLRRLAGDKATPTELAALRAFVDVVEPVKDYRRGGQQPNPTQLTPLDGLVDCSRPNSTVARIFAGQVEAVVMTKSVNPARVAVIARQLNEWKAAASVLTSGLAQQSSRLQSAQPLFAALTTACAVGEEALQLYSSDSAPPEGWGQRQSTLLDAAAQPHDAAELAIIPALKLLVVAASERSRREERSDEAWRQHLRFIVAQSAEPVRSPP